MKVSASALVLYLAGYVAAQGMNGGSGPAAVASKWVRAAENMHDMNMFNLKAVLGQLRGSLFTEDIFGSEADVNNFIDQIDIKTVKQIEGDNFGAPFKFTLYEYPSEKYLGYISGYFTSDGLQFDSDSQLPSGATLPSGGGGGGSGGFSIKSFTGKADADTTKDIIKNGKISDEQLKKIMGDEYGKKPFQITLTGDGGGKIGQVVGGFNKDGIVIDDERTSIPKPSATTSAPPATSSTMAPGDDDANANHGQVTIGGSSDQIKSQLNNLSYDYIKNATGGKYGPFYITFMSKDGNITGYIKGTISPNSYSYKWAYTYKS